MVIYSKNVQGVDFVMSKIWEKKNLGIPVTLLVLIAYFIGYSFMFDLYNLLVALIFGGIVFVLDFDERVKTAVKQSYTISLLFSLVNFLVIILNHISLIFNNRQNIYDSNMSGSFTLKTFLYDIYNFTNDFLNIVAVIVFAIFIIATIMKKDIKLNFILNILGEGTPKQPKQPKPVYQQGPMMYQQPAMQQQSPMQQQAGMQQQMPPQPVPLTVCPICHVPVKSDAVFCGNCGNKLQ